MTRVKICGLTRLEDALWAAACGADLLGFIFYPPSRRFVPPDRARQIVRDLANVGSAAHSVGVFVDETVDGVERTVQACGLDYAQLHGGETPEMTAALMARGIAVIKAFRVRNAATLAKMERYRAAAYLLDAYHPSRPGGTGQRFDWSLAAQAQVPGSLILAGGLTCANVAQAIGIVRPWGVDVAGGVEAAPGRKDPVLVQRFITAAKEAEHAPPATQKVGRKMP